jgi:hypothetical protein
MPAKLRSIAFLPTRLAAGALAAAMMVGSATPAWAEPSAKLVKCAAGHCLLVSGHREDAASPVRINGHAVAVEGRRNWRARLPLESVRDMLGVSQELRENLCIAAHLAHVAYAGRIDADGNIVPRYQITMATGIDEQTCKRVNLGYLDYRTFDYETNRSDPDTLIVHDAGRDLYKV